MARKLKQQIVIETVDETTSTVGKIDNAFNRLGRTIVALGAAGVAGRALSSFIGLLRRGAQAALEQERVNTRLLQSLRSLGPEAQSAASALRDQADALQSLGVASNESIQSVQALLANLGVTPNRLQEATEAAANLSIALGVSLETAARQLGRTFGGFAGELGEVIPELRGLSTEALRAGEALDIVGEKFAGNIEANANTAAAALTRVNEALADTVKTLGSPSTSESAIGATNTLGESIETLNSRLDTSIRQGYFAKLQAGAVAAAAGYVTLYTEIFTFLGILQKANETQEKAIEVTEKLDRSSQIAARARAEEREELRNLEKNIELLEAIRRKEIEAAEESARQTQREIDQRRGLIPVTEELGEGEDNLRDKREDLLIPTEQLIDLNGQLQASYDRVQESANRAVQQATTATNTLSSLRTRDPRNQARLERALASGHSPRVIQGGTRVRVGGRSFLLEEGQA